MIEEKLNFVFDEAYKFLVEATSEDEVNRIISYYLKNPKNMQNVFLVMIQSLRNRQGYERLIADAREMTDILFNFDNLKVKESYSNLKEIFLNLNS